MSALSEHVVHVKIKVLETVSSTYMMGRYNHSLSLDATIMVSKDCPTIGEHVTIFVTQQVTITTVLLAKNIFNYSVRGL